MAREFSEDKARQGTEHQHGVRGSAQSRVRTAGVRSTDQKAGGSLGWKTRGSLHGDFEKVAYDLEASTTANPKCELPYLIDHCYNDRPCYVGASCPRKPDSKRVIQRHFRCVRKRKEIRDADIRCLPCCRERFEKRTVNHHSLTDRRHRCGSENQSWLPHHHGRGKEMTRD